MMGKKTANKTKPAAVVANDADGQKGTLKEFGGSRFDDWNDIITRQTVDALWVKHSGPETRDKQLSAALAALIGIGPKDELEGVGVVEPAGGGDRIKLEDQRHARQIADARQPEMRCPLPDDRAAVPTGSNAERSMPDARRTIDGGAEG
jgi:hypothetical protein